MWSDLQTTNPIIFSSKHIIIIVEDNLTNKFKIISNFKQKYCRFRLKLLSDFLLPNLSNRPFR